MGISEETFCRWKKQRVGREADHIRHSNQPPKAARRFPDKLLSGQTILG